MNIMDYLIYFTNRSKPVQASARLRLAKSMLELLLFFLLLLFSRPNIASDNHSEFASVQSYGLVLVTGKKLHCSLGLVQLTCASESIFLCSITHTKPFGNYFNAGYVYPLNQLVNISNQFLRLLARDLLLISPRHFYERHCTFICFLQSRLDNFITN